MSYRKRWAEAEQVYACSNCSELVNHDELVEHQNTRCAKSLGRSVGMWRVCKPCGGSGGRLSSHTDGRVACYQCRGHGGAIEPKP